MTKLTAVEWLENEFQEMCKDFGGVHSDFIVKFDQAKAMEKKQIINAYQQAEKDNGRHWLHGDLYYNETFKSE